MKKRKPEECKVMLDVGISVQSNLETCLYLYLMS